jgi:hypothetical protein
VGDNSGTPRCLANVLSSSWSEATSIAAACQKPSGSRRRAFRSDPSKTTPNRKSRISGHMTGLTHAAVPAITTLGYAGILVGPAAIGFVAHSASLSVAFLCLTVLLAGVAVSGHLRDGCQETRAAALAKCRALPVSSSLRRPRPCSRDKLGHYFLAARARIEDRHDVGAADADKRVAEQHGLPDRHQRCDCETHGSA